MRAQVSQHTAPEIALRRILHARGLRFRVQVRLLPRRTVDIVFSRAKVAIDVRGDFWHGCPLHRSQPRANAEWWARKIAGNIARDIDTVERLTAKGWTVLVVWECEPPLQAADRVAAAVALRRSLCSATGDIPPDNNGLA